jgi:hypothetical protein
VSALTTTLPGECTYHYATGLSYNESDTMERLRDGQVKLGAARYEDYAGCQRQIVNQMRTTTVSRHMLLNVLERRSGYLWVCPVCKGDNLLTNHYSLSFKKCIATKKCVYMGMVS